MRDAQTVRTTIDIADDVLQAVRELAELRGETLGAQLSALVRKGLETAAPTAAIRNGVPLLPGRRERGAKPTMKLVNSLRDES